MKRLLLALVIASPASVSAMDLLIGKGSIAAPSSLGIDGIRRSNGKFFIIQGDKEWPSFDHDVDPIINDLDDEKLYCALQHNKIKVSQVGDDYKLQLQGRLVGGDGGLVTGAMAVWIAAIVIKAIRDAKR